MRVQPRQPSFEKPSEECFPFLRTFAESQPGDYLASRKGQPRAFHTIMAWGRNKRAGLPGFPGFEESRYWRIESAETFGFMASAESKAELVKS